MRLIHCLVDNDRTKQAYLQRNDLDTSCLSLENRNSDIREPTVFEMISDCWNDPCFEPLTEELPDLHPDFQFSEKMSFDLVFDMAKATLQKIKDKLQSLNFSLTQIVAMWKQSRQGDGGKLVDEEDCDIHEGVGETILPEAGLF